MGRAACILGRDENGQQQFHWVGRFATTRERDDAVARARTERPWDGAPRPTRRHATSGPTGCSSAWSPARCARRPGARYKTSSIDTARSSSKRSAQTFGRRTPASITRIEAEDWAARVPPSKLPIVVSR